MANTNLLKDIEHYVRHWCSKKYGIEFETNEKEIQLVTGGIHRFDVVAKDGSVIAGVKTSTLRENGRVGVGTIKSTFTELYFLSLVKANKRLMILTDQGYYTHFRKVSNAKVAEGIEIIYCPLPEEIERNIAIIHKNCREEIGKKK